MSSHTGVFDRINGLPGVGMTIIGNKLVYEALYPIESDRQIIDYGQALALIADTIESGLFLKLDGTTPMLGNVDVNGNDVLKVGGITDIGGGLSVDVSGRFLRGLLNKPVAGWSDVADGLELYTASNIASYLKPTSTSVERFYLPDKAGEGGVIALLDDVLERGDWFADGSGGPATNTWGFDGNYFTGWTGTQNVSLPITLVNVDGGDDAALLIDNGRFFFSASDGMNSAQVEGLADGTVNVFGTTVNLGTDPTTGIVNIGNAGGVVNILGTALYEYVGNQYVLDKLITLNYNGAAGSASGAGFEVEEDNLITAYFKTNGARNGYSIKAPGIASALNFDLSLFTAPHIQKVPDGDGVYVLDILAQTLTNKTLTSPIINLGSDATGDDYYRSAGGAFTRRAIGSNGQLSIVNSGLKSWQTLSLNGAAGSFSLSQLGVLTMPDASAASRGLLNLTDWNTFNSKAKSMSVSAVKTGTYTAQPEEIVPTNSTSASVPITLPTTPANGTIIEVVQIAVGFGFVTTVTCGGADVMNIAGGSTSTTIRQLAEAKRFQYFSGIWYITGSNHALSQLDSRYFSKAVTNDDTNAASATPKDVPGWTIAVEANKTYTIDGFLRIDSTAAVAGIRLYFQGPAGATIDVTLEAPASSLATRQSVTLTTLNTGSGATSGTSSAACWAIIKGTFTTAGTAGNFVVQFGPVTNGQTTKVKQAGSFLSLKPIL